MCLGILGAEEKETKKPQHGLVTIHVRMCDFAMLPHVTAPTTPQPFLVSKP